MSQHASTWQATGAPPQAAGAPPPQVHSRKSAGAPPSVCRCTPPQATGALSGHRCTPTAGHRCAPPVHRCAPPQGHSRKSAGAPPLSSQVHPPPQAIGTPPLRPQVRPPSHRFTVRNPQVRPPSVCRCTPQATGALPPQAAGAPLQLYWAFMLISPWLSILDQVLVPLFCPVAARGCLSLRLAHRMCASCGLASLLRGPQGFWGSGDPLVSLRELG